MVQAQVTRSGSTTGSFSVEPIPTDVQGIQTFFNRITTEFASLNARLPELTQTCLNLLSLWTAKEEAVKVLERNFLITHDWESHGKTNAEQRDAIMENTLGEDAEYIGLKDEMEDLHAQWKMANVAVETSVNHLALLKRQMDFCTELIGVVATISSPSSPSTPSHR